MKRKITLFALIALIVCTPATSVIAKSPKVEAREAAYGRRILREFAACVVDSHRNLARQFALMRSNDRLNDTDFQKLASGRCLGFRGGILKMHPEYFRGALANRLVIVDLSGEPPLIPDNIPPLEWDQPLPPTDAVFASDKPVPNFDEAKQKQKYDLALAFTLTAQLGECVVRKDAAASRIVLETAVDSPDELAKLKEMNVTIAKCVASGQTLSFNRTNLRNSIAISYYRLANAQRNSGALR
jgi:hypothetical protein